VAEFEAGGTYIEPGFHVATVIASVGPVGDQSWLLGRMFGSKRLLVSICIFPQAVRKAMVLPYFGFH
jgi:hypothetical protein